MTNNDTPTAEQLAIKHLESIKSGLWKDVYGTSEDFKTICESYLLLLEELKIAKEALTEIADKECNHAYPSKVMKDLCEACNARVALSKLTI